MFDAFSKNTLVSLILRLTLGAIFIYHGVDKIFGPSNEWGSAWADNAWDQQAKPPAELEPRLVGLEREDPQRMKEVYEKLVAVYKEGSPFKPPTMESHAVQMAVAWGELIGGAALVLGLLVRVAAVGLIVIQVGAVVLVTYVKGFSFAGGGGYEYNLALLAMCLALVVLGAGNLSVWRLFAGKRPEPRQQPAAVTV